MFRTPRGYLAWVDGLGTVEGRTLSETRREARRFVEAVVGGAFPDRPRVEAAGAREVLEFAVDIRMRRAPTGVPRASSVRSPDAGA